MARTGTIAIAAAIVAVVGVGGTYLWSELRQTTGDFAQCTRGSVAGGALGGPFTLVSETGETVTDADVIDRPTLIYFGYTFCPDVCPLDSMRNALALEMLEERGVDAKGVFITVDPARDDVEVVRDFTDNFHEDMLGLTGTAEQVDAAAKAYRVYYDARIEEDPEFYLVDHSAFTYLVLPEAGFIDVFRREAAPEEIADTVQCVAEVARV
ncbi:SCO family protein [Histidinibacterium lentulum]|uniref:SCO family protein n=1 Tax=Histidinibacterium lentulum TaxID=2480588 RepID=A0A3N2R6S3_9RHOB|nr:SCO family protein [Histidinibacterium lentulum]ROU03185.1 SCO family protein [Histidinibacterium lentulum]